MSNNPFNTSFDTRPSWERGTAQDFTNSMNAAAWDRQQQSGNGGGGGFSGRGDRSLAGRAKAFGGVGLLLGLLAGALQGGGHHSLVSSTLVGMAGGAMVGAGFGVAWHLLMMMFGGVARTLNLPVIRDAIRGAIFGALAGLAVAFFTGEMNDPMPLVAVLAVLGAGLGVVLGLVLLVHRAASRTKASVTLPDETAPTA
jgi:hypothetical protein